MTGAVRAREQRPAEGRVHPRALRLARVGGATGTIAFLLGMVSMVMNRSTFALDFAVFHLGGTLLRRDGYDAVYDRDLFRATLETDYRPEADLADSLTYFISPPPFAWLSQSWSLLSYDVALVVWLAAGAAALVLSVRLLGLPWWAAAAFATTPAVVMNTTIGQSGLFFLLLAVLVHRAIVADRLVLAGLLVGLFVLKPPLAIGWALWWLLDLRRWSRSIVAACASAGVLLIPTLGSRGEAWGNFIDVMTERVGDESSLQVNSMSLAEFLKLLAPNAPAFMTAAAWLLAAAAGLVVLRLAERRWSEYPDVVSAVAIAVTVGVSPHLSVYDTGLLLVPCAVLLHRGALNPERLTAVWAIAVVGVTFGPAWFVAQYDIVGRGIGLEFPAIFLCGWLAARWMDDASVAVLADTRAVDREREHLIVGQ